MNQNSSLLESLLSLAILKRQRDRKRKNFILHESYEIKYNKYGDIRKTCDGEVNSELDLNEICSNDSYTNSANSSEDGNIIERRETEYITTYSFNKYTKTISKTLIHRDNDELKKVRELTNKITYRRVMCDICGNCFNEKNLKFHMYKHNNYFPYKCMFNNCKRAFTSAEMLKQHQNFHCKVKRYKCEFCNRTFYMPNSLKKHRLLHFDPTIECNECGKMFHTESSLKIHNEKVHLGLKKYACDICDKRYFSHNSLRKHLITIHDRKFISQRIIR